MDRKIRFRVYDKKVGEMVDTGMHVIGESFCCGRIEFWIKEHREAKGDKTIIERYNDMVLMEWTGLQDKEGQDIYEGDIVETPKGWREVVKWNKRRAGFQPFSHPSSCFLEDTRVLGNKFEDPELLDGGK